MIVCDECKKEESFKKTIYETESDWINVELLTTQSEFLDSRLKIPKDFCSLPCAINHLNRIEEKKKNGGIMEKPVRPKKKVFDKPIKPSETIFRSYYFKSYDGINGEVKGLWTEEECDRLWTNYFLNNKKVYEDAYGTREEDLECAQDDFGPFDQDPIDSDYFLASLEKLKFSLRKEGFHSFSISINVYSYSEYNSGIYLSVKINVPKDKLEEQQKQYEEDYKKYKANIAQEKIDFTKRKQEYQVELAKLKLFEAERKLEKLNA